jgi:hypothetical protein
VPNAALFAAASLVAALARCEREGATVGGSADAVGIGLRTHSIS